MDVFVVTNSGCPGDRGASSNARDHPAAWSSTSPLTALSDWSSASATTFESAGPRQGLRDIRYVAEAARPRHGDPAARADVRPPRAALDLIAGRINPQVTTGHHGRRQLLGNLGQLLQGLASW